MKQMLSKLTRNELIELGYKYIEGFHTQQPSKTIIHKLASVKFDEEDLAWIEKLNAAEEAEALPSQDVSNVQKPEIREEYVNEDGQLLSTTEIEQKAISKGKREISSIVAEAKRKANKMVIVHITPLSREDLSINKTAELFVTGNAYFSLSVIVPFNVYVEVPLAIAQVAKEATCLNVIPLSKYEQNNRQFHPMAIGSMGRKYNVQIWTKEEFAKIQSRQ